jgi:hypothetical protein
LQSEAREILARFEARAGELADEIAACTLAEVEGFGPINDADLFAEIRTLARAHLGAFAAAALSAAAPSPAILAAARERAVARAREMVPLAALLHSYLIAQRVISAAIAKEAGPDAQSRGAALLLTSRTFDYNIAVTSAMADAYIEFVQGDLAELDSARRSLVDALLTSDAGALPALTRRATGLGLDPNRTYVVAVAVVDVPDASLGAPRWASQAIARSSGRPERQAFVVSRERDLVALLDATGPHVSRVVLEQAQVTVRQMHRSALRAGVGAPFLGLKGFSDSYQDARRALRYADARRPFVFWPQDVPLFDELTASSSDDAARLIPEATRRVLADPTFRDTIEAFFAADLNVAAAATALFLHPNSVRYRLRRVAEMTRRDPRRLADMVELIAAARLMAARAAHQPDGGAGGPTGE